MNTVFVRVGNANYEVSGGNFGELVQTLQTWADTHGRPAIATLTVLPARARQANDWINTTLKEIAR